MDSLNDVMEDRRRMRFVRICDNPRKFLSHHSYLPVDYATHNLLVNTCTLERPNDLALRYPPELELAVKLHCHLLGY